MAWTERQHALLREMGIRLWSPPAGGTVDAGDNLALLDAPAAQAAEAPTSQPDEARKLSPIAAHLPALAATASAVSGEHRALPAAVLPPTGNLPSGLSSMDWPALREAVAQCRACGLCEGRTQTVFGLGHPQAQWMLVGEAPGEQEDQQGEPFVGKAGQLLDAMLRAVGLTREDAPADKQVYITNVLKCRPPHNRNPQPQEVAQCEPFLLRQVELVQPKLILAMGRFAVQSLLQTQEPIGRLRGRLHHYQGVPVVVTYHPAYLLRNPLDKARSWDDLCLAREVLSQAPAR